MCLTYNISSMPTIPLYLKERIYWRIAYEAEKNGMTTGKFIATILEDYVNYLDTQERRTISPGDMK